MDPNDPLGRRKEKNRVNSYDDGDIPGMPPTQPSETKGRDDKRALARTAGGPFGRLLGLEDTAAYLGISSWTVRELEWAGVLPRVRIPLPNGKELRKILFDRQDLDRLVEAWKDRSWQRN